MDVPFRELLTDVTRVLEIQECWTLERDCVGAMPH